MKVRPVDRIGHELRCLRELRASSGEAVAAELGWSQSKVSRIESARLGVTVADLTDLLRVLAASPGQRIELLALAARASDENAWLISEGTLQGRQAEVGAVERRVSRLREHHPMLVPGLLQAPAFMAAMADSAGFPSVSEFVEERLARQAVLEEPGAPAYEAIMDARCLRRTAGGRSVLEEQLKYLLLKSRLPSVTLRIVPESQEAHMIAIGAFVMYEFRAEDVPDVVMVETPLTDVYYASDEAWQTYSTMWDRLVADSLSVDESRAWLRQQLQQIGD